MTTDALLVSVAGYPNADGVLRPLPGVAKDNTRVRNWLAKYAPDVEVHDLFWPVEKGNPKDLFSASKVEDEIRKLVVRSSGQQRDRLFIHFSGHGLQKPTVPAFPALYCALHSRSLPDIFPSFFWLPALTLLPGYKQYLIFLDCCNDDQTDPLPAEPNIRLMQRADDDRASVLVIAAAQPNQQALEDKNGALFTGVLLEAMSGSAGAPDTDVVTAADVVNYVKEEVPIRANRMSPGKTQLPREWHDDRHVPLKDYVMFHRSKVKDVSLAGLLDGHAADNLEVLDGAFAPIAGATVTLEPATQAPVVSGVYPGRYILRDRGDTNWVRAFRIRTPVDEKGDVSTIAEAVDLS
jgi:hypothetical protein